MSSLRILILAAGACAVAAPAIAGEITGNGKSLEINARSECVYSGLNDHDGDPRDPGEHTQSYGTLVSIGWVNPQDADPNADFFQPIPGYACNPNRGRDLHAE